MKTPLQAADAVRLGLPDSGSDFYELMLYKSLYFPPDPTGELSMRIQTRVAFESAGYRVRQAGKADTHAVFILRLVRTNAQRFAGGGQFIQHIRDVLKTVVSGHEKPLWLSAGPATGCWWRFRWSRQQVEDILPRRAAG